MKHSENDELYMKRALSIAQSNAVSSGGGPFGAVIVKDGKIIAESSNSVTVDNDPTAHAEVNAIRLACKVLDTFDLSGCVIYSSCEPCPMCLSAIYWAHIDRLLFAADRVDAAKAGFDDDFIYRELALPLNERSIKVERIMPLEGLLPFESWIHNDNKRAY